MTAYQAAKNNFMSRDCNFYQVGVKVNDGNGAVSVSVTPRESLCDGKFHVVTGVTSHADNITQTYIHE